MKEFAKHFTLLCILFIVIVFGSNVVLAIENFRNNRIDDAKGCFGATFFLKLNLAKNSLNVFAFNCVIKSKSHSTLDEIYVERNYIKISKSHQ